MSGKSGKSGKEEISICSPIFLKYEKCGISYYCMSSSKADDDIKHRLLCGCNEPNREKNLYTASEKLASEMGAEKMTRDKRDDLKEGDVMIFNGMPHVFDHYSTHFDADVSSGNYSILFKDRKEVLYDLFSLWETNNQHRIPYDHVYVVFNKK